jgi:hypothetical protein
MWHKAMLCGLPISAANLNAGHDGCSPGDAINPAPACKAEKIFWRSVAATDRVHYTVAQHPIRPDEACNPHLVPGAPIETVELETNQRDVPAQVKS